MALTITHRKVSSVPDDADPNTISPSDWNSTHLIAGTIAAGEITSPAALSRTSDTNVTLTLGGNPNSALLDSVSITAGWTGTLAAARLNASVPHSVANDTNVTGTINAQLFTLGWTGTLAVSRGGTGVASGISGGVLYFSSSTALATSSALAAGQVVVGGGAGAAPATIAPGQLPATSTNDDAAATKVGELLTTSTTFANRVPLTTGSALPVASMAVTAGDWDISGTVTIVGASGTLINQAAAGISLQSTTFPAEGAYTQQVWGSTGISSTNLFAPNLPTGAVRQSFSATTSVYLIGYAAFSVSTMSAYGTLRARRIR